MSHSLVADIARLMLKSHIELSRIPATPALILSALPRAASLPGGGNPFEFRVTAAPGVRVYCAVDPQGQMTLAASQGERSYTAKLPARGDLAALRATIALADGRRYRELEISGQDFLDGAGVPADYSELHRLVVAHAKRYFPQGSEEGAPAADAAPSSEAVAMQAAPAKEGEQASQMRQFRIYRPQERDLVFTGECLANVTGPVVQGRCWSFALFKTQGGKFVGFKQGHSSRLGEADRVETVVADSLEGTQALFGTGLLAKQLYRQVGVDLVEIID